MVVIFFTMHVLPVCQNSASQVVFFNPYSAQTYHTFQTKPTELARNAGNTSLSGKIMHQQGALVVVPRPAQPISARHCSGTPPSEGEEHFHRQVHLVCKYCICK